MQVGVLLVYHKNHGIGLLLADGSNYFQRPMANQQNFAELVPILPELKFLSILKEPTYELTNGQAV